MVIFKYFFAKSISDEYCFFCYRRKQNYHIRYSDRTFDTCQIEISVELVSIAKGFRFTYWSRFSFIENLQQLDNDTDSHFKRRRERATNTHRLINTFERNEITQKNDFLKRYCIIFWKWRKNDYSILKQMKISL